MLLTRTFYFHLFLLLTFQSFLFLLLFICLLDTHPISLNVSGFLSFFFQLICRYPFLPKWVLFPSFFILQPKGLTFPGSQHPPFFQLVLRRSKLLLTPVTAIVSFCFVSTSCFLLLCVCFFNTNHCLSHSMTYVSQQWFKRNVFVDKSSFMIY